MARKRPIASPARKPALACLEGGRPTADGPLLPRAEAAALRRGAPLTHAKLTERFAGQPNAPAPVGDAHDAYASRSRRTGQSA